MEPTESLAAYCVYYMAVGFAVAAGLHLIASVVGVFKAHVSDALLGK